MRMLLISPHGLGDQALMLPLLNRLRQESPNIRIDLVARQELKDTVRLLPIRRAYLYDFASWHREYYFHQTLTCPDAPWRHTEYDRVIAFYTFPFSRFLWDLVSTPDRRGATHTEQETALAHGGWWQYSAIYGTFRDLNLFHFGDLYALAGSGAGPYVRPHITLPAHAQEWARQALAQVACDVRWVGVHVGASTTLKRWKPAQFGEAMALLSRHAKVGFVLTGTEPEHDAVRETMRVYRLAGGVGPLYDAVHAPDLAHSLALLQHCPVMLANDTGLMHWGAAVGCTVLNVSVGPVSPQETAAYGAGHWAIQGDAACAPCLLYDACSHQSCKDLVTGDAVVSVMRHLLDHTPLPTFWPGVKVYRSRVDADGLVRYEQQGGRQDAHTDWWARYWRGYWYERLTGRLSLEPGPVGFAPCTEDDREKNRHVAGVLRDAIALIEQALTCTDRATVDHLKVRIGALVWEAHDVSLTSPTLRPPLAWAQLGLIHAQRDGQQELATFRAWWDMLQASAHLHHAA